MLWKLLWYLSSTELEDGLDMSFMRIWLIRPATTHEKGTRVGQLV
jgi:hypothetical protein